MNLAKLARRIEKLASDNSPAILTGIGVTGTIATAYLASKASFKAARILESEDPDASFAKKANMVWPEYIPAAATGLVTIGCILGANHIGGRRTAALAAAYSMSDKALNEYKDKVVEKFGENKARETRDEIAADQVRKNPPKTANGDQIVLPVGDVLCREAFTGRYFQCSIERLKRAENKINQRIMQDDYASLSDFYALVGLPNNELGDEMGWQSPTQMEMDISTALSDDDRPCAVVHYNIDPIRNYHKFA